MLKIGWAQKDIGTDHPIAIPGQGYIRVSHGVLDSLTATALTLENNGEYVIFVQVDLVNINAGVLNAIREKVAAKNPSIDPLKILMNCSHTHTGPLTSADNRVGAWGDYDKLPLDGIELEAPQEYFRFFTDRVCEAVCESFDSLKAGSMAYGYGYAVVAHSRRVVYSKSLAEGVTGIEAQFTDGHAKMYGKTTLPHFSHYEAGADHFSNFMFTFDENDKLTGAIVNIPCPSQNNEIEWLLSADYWHDVRQELRKRYGDIFILPQCAAAGDLAPRQLHYNDAQDRRYRLKYADYKPDERLINPVEMYNRMDIAERICDSFDEVYAWAKTEKFNDAPIYHTVKTVQLEKWMVSDEEYAYCKQKAEELRKTTQFVSTDDKQDDFKWNTRKIDIINDYQSIVNRYEEQRDQETYPMEMHVIRVGEIAFASNQFELYMDYQHRIQARSPFQQTFIVQLCAQPGHRSGSYLPTERAVAGKGYSAIMWSNQVTPNGGQQLVEETLAELKKLAEKE